MDKTDYEKYWHHRNEANRCERQLMSTQSWGRTKAEYGDLTRERDYHRDMRNHYKCKMVRAACDVA